MNAKRPIADVSAIALVLAPVAKAGQPVLTLAPQALHATPPTALPQSLPAGLRALAAQLPPWRGLGLLAALAQRDPQTPQTLYLHVDESQSLAVRLQGELGAMQPSDAADPSDALSTPPVLGAPSA